MESTLLFDKRADQRSRIRSALATLPSVSFRLSEGHKLWPAPFWPGEGMPIVARVSGDSLDQLRAVAAPLRERFRQIDGIVELDADLADLMPQLSLAIDRCHPWLNWSLFICKTRAPCDDSIIQTPNDKWWRT